MKNGSPVGLVGAALAVLLTNGDALGALSRSWSRSELALGAGVDRFSKPVSPKTVPLDRLLLPLPALGPKFKRSILGSCG